MLKPEIQEILRDYTNWLVKKGYTDTDPIFEEPYAVDEFMKYLEAKTPPQAE